MDNATPFLPRIYFLNTRLVTELSELEACLDRCVAMGFDHVLVPAPIEPHERDTAFANLVHSCPQKGLRLLVDLDLGSIGKDASLLAGHPSWFVEPGADDDLPDPRKPVQVQGRRKLRFADGGRAGSGAPTPGAPTPGAPTSIEDELLDYWQRRLCSWMDAGVSGFRCLAVAEAPPHFWRRLVNATRARHTGARFLAWTPGCTPEQLAALAVQPGENQLFDATFSSGAWWDYRSRWLVEEHERLTRVAPPIAFPDSPNEGVIERLAGNETSDVRRRIYLRALGLAAATGNGILIPMGFEHGTPRMATVKPAFDLTADIARANATMAASGPAMVRGGLSMLSGADSGVAVLLRQGLGDDAWLIVANANVVHSCVVNEAELLRRAEGYIRYRRIPLRDDMGQGSLDGPMATEPVALAPADLQVFAARRLAAILWPADHSDKAVTVAAQSPRIAIESITPSVDGGLFPVKRTVGESVTIEADVFLDGHDKLAVVLLWRCADESEWRETRMRAVGNDRWAAALPLTRIGRYLFAVEAWRDAFSTYRDELEKKATAGLNVSLELEEGRLLVLTAAAHARSKGITSAANTLEKLARSLEVKQEGEEGKVETTDDERIAALLSEPTADAMRLADARPFAARSDPAMTIEVERTAARFSSWYELFPRSQSGDPDRHGTFDDVIRRLPAIQAMGFDTLYFPPIHPIGRKHRKGRNNSLTPGPDDPGSPYAIGSEEGGHDAIHPELGSLDDFRRLRDEAARHGLELALDFAIQCSPDHPWLRDHPEWFAWRPDGSIRYAENPPKKYQDIVNVDFYAEGAIPGLWIALRDAVLFWVREGVRVFRVDNPHTKPLPFWEWMINDIRSRYPDTIFLSEAFTRPRMMYRLAKIGYSQSYTYFTWRHTKDEFIDYMTELTTSPVREYFRPHFFVNTPDINPYFLQKSGRPGFLIRAALATTLSGLWGMYSGFELCEGTPVPGKEEYLDSEKYEIRAWDWQRPGNIIREITVLNHLRIQNPALQSHLGVRFLNASDGNILYFMKSTEPTDSCQRFGDNVVLVAINLDPYHPHETTLELPLQEFGLPENGTLELDDLINGGRVAWTGRHQRLRLDPFVCPYAVWRVRHQGA